METKRRGSRVFQKRHEAVHPLLSDGDRGDRWHLEPLFQPLQLRHDPPVSGLVRHVHGEHEGNAHFGELNRDHQGSPHVFCVADLQDPGSRFAHQDVPRHPFVFRQGQKGIDPGSVDDLHGFSAFSGLPPRHLDRGSRIVGDRHVPACQMAEEHALPDVGVTDQNHFFPRRHGGFGPFPHSFSRILFSSDAH